MFTLNVNKPKQMEHECKLVQRMEDLVVSGHWMIVFFFFFGGVKSNITVWLDWLRLLPVFHLQVRIEELEEELEAERAMRVKVPALILQ